MDRQYRVGILGATGTVGQRFAQLLEDHPQFEITAMAASDRSVGKPYTEACVWKLPGKMPAAVRDIVVQPIEPPLDCDIVFSSLPSTVAREAEEAFARAGYPVISNSSVYRMDEDVPLLIAEINHDHVGLIERQREKRGFTSGFIVTNPNCAVASFAPPLAAIHRRFGLESVIVTTMQAISGAGYPGVPSLDITDNVFPYIAGEEPKVEIEAQKILGTFADGVVQKADFTVSAQCFRRKCDRRAHGVGTREFEADGDARGRGRRDADVSVARPAFVAETVHRRHRRTFASAAAARPRQWRRYVDNGRTRLPGQHIRLSVCRPQPQHGQRCSRLGDFERGIVDLQRFDLIFHLHLSRPTLPPCCQ